MTLTRPKGVAVTTEWIGDDADLRKPSAARIYDHMLGGGHNFAARQADPACRVGVLDRYRAALAPGSHVAITHLTNDFAQFEAGLMAEMTKRATDNIFPPTRDEVIELFAGFDLLQPGVVTTSRWRPDSAIERSSADTGSDGLYAGVGRRK